MDIYIPSRSKLNNDPLKTPVHRQYLETVCAVCRANEWQGSSPLAGKGQKLFVPLSAFMPEESCTVILTLSYFS